MTTMPRPAPYAPFDPDGTSAVEDVARRLGELDTAGLELRTTEPGKVVSVYRTAPEVTLALTELARTGRHTLPLLGWTLELSPAETVLVLTGPVGVLDGLLDAPHTP
jgi:hypothetical protein